MSQCIESNERKVEATNSLIISFHSYWKTLNDFKNGMSTNFRMCFDIEVWSIVNLVWWAVRSSWSVICKVVEVLIVLRGCCALFCFLYRHVFRVQRRDGGGLVMETLSANQSWAQGSIDQSEDRIVSAALGWRGSLYFYGIDNRASLPWSPSTTQY